MEWFIYFAIAVAIVGGLYLLRKSSSFVNGIVGVIDDIIDAIF